MKEIKNQQLRRGRRPTEEITEPQQNTLAEIANFLAAKGYPPSIKELAEILGISQMSTHAQVEQLIRKGYLKREPGKARSLNIIREPESRITELVAVPIVGKVAAGTPILAVENITGEILIDDKAARSGRCFALEVVGDSMIDAGITEGDLVIVRQQPLAESGDIVVALLDDEATVKRLYVRDARIELRPENPKLHPIPIGPDNDLRILGKVVAIRHTRD